MRRCLWRAALCLALFSLVLINGALAAEPLKLFFPSSTSSPLAATLKDLTTKYNAAGSAIPVEAIYGGNQTENVAKALTAFAGGNPPDMIIASAQDSYTFYDAKAIVPIDEYVKAAGDKKFLGQFYQPFLGTSWINKTQYGIPWQKSTALLYWNKQAFKDAGLNPDTPPSDWKQLVDMAKKLTKIDNNGNIRQYGITIPFDFWVLAAFVTQTGGTMSDPDGKFAYLDNPKTIEALQFLVDLVQTHRVTPPKRSWGEASNDFVAGYTAMLYHSTGNLGFLRSSAKFDFGAAFLPAGKRGYGCCVGGAQFYIFKTTPERQKACWDFIKWMMRDENTAYWMAKTGYLALKPSALKLPEIETLIKEDPRSKVAFDQLKYAKDDPVWHEGSRVIEIINNSIFDAVYGHLSAAASMKKAQKEIDAILVKYR